MAKLRRSSDVYIYDGSFAGLLCCIYESYACHELPAGISIEMPSQLTFFPFREVGTNTCKARKVAASIRSSIGADALRLALHAYMSCLPQSELNVLLFLRLCYQEGRRVIRQLAHPYVEPLWKAERTLYNEAHLHKEFARFSSRGGVLLSEIEPKCLVLPLLAGHFCTRFRNERFVICDRSHSQALLYAQGKASIVEAADLRAPEADEDEETFRSLWRLYLDTMPVEGRDNRRCQIAHMPKRFWKNMPEMLETSVRVLPERFQDIP